DQPDGFFDAKLLLSIELVPEAFALDEGHHVVEQALGSAGIVQAEDVGMLEAGRDFDLAIEPVGAERGGQLRSQDLDGDLAIVSEVLGQIDSRHAAPAEFTLDRVAVHQDQAEPLQSVAYQRIAQLRPQIGGVSDYTAAEPTMAGRELPEIGGGGPPPRGGGPPGGGH